MDQLNCTQPVWETHDALAAFESFSVSTRQTTQLRKFQTKQQEMENQNIDLGKPYLIRCCS